MKFKKILLICFLFSVLIARSQDTTKVLFIGNSFTSQNNLPNLFMQLSQSSGNNQVGDYFAIVTNSFGCTFRTLEGSYLLTNIVENQLNSQVQIAISPNPAVNYILVDNIGSHNEQATLKIYNALGNLVKTETLVQTQQQIDLTDLPNGIFFIEIMNQNLIKSMKLIIQK